MKETIKKQFIEYLLQSNDAKSSLECANFLNISSRKAKDEMKELNLELCNYGAEIKSKSGRGNGYRLVVNDENKFNYYFNEVLVENIVFDKKCFDDQESRINYIINQFLVTKGYLKMEDLATDLCISLSQLKKDMVIVKKLLNKYHLVLNHKPYYGMILEGSELDCRLCIAKHIQYNLENDNLTVYSNNQDFSQQLIIIQNILMKNSKAFDYELSDMTCKNLVSHLFVAMNRSIRNDKIKFDDKIKESIKNESTFALAAKIIKDINAEFNTALNDDEVYYCTIHLCGKRIVEDSFLFDKSILECLDEIVDTIYIKYGLDFRDNLDLKTMMGLHLIPMLSRIRYKLILKNPLIKEIKTNFILAYDLAVSASSIINKRFECEISDDEISYFALHFKLAMSENKKKKIFLLYVLQAEEVQNFWKCNLKRSL